MSCAWGRAHGKILWHKLAAGDSATNRPILQGNNGMLEKNLSRARRIAALSAVLAAGLASTARGASPTGETGALETGYLGLYDAALFRPVDGPCPDCSTPKQALWYFHDDVVAVPKEATANGPLDSRLPVPADIQQWFASGDKARAALPFMVWLGSTQLAEKASVQPDGASLRFADGSIMPFGVVPKIATNLSYYNDATAQFFSKRPLRVRGRAESGAGDQQRFVARVIWPGDYRINAGALQPEPLRAGESLTDLLKAEDGGARSAFGTRLIWERSPGGVRDGQRKAVLAFMLNGAQGDDDEAHGGHFAVVTGWHRADGRWADWMVNNFYNLNSVSEKGIIAAMLPMDNYLMDLNSGQSYYRPSYLVAAVLKQATAASLYQNAVGRVYDRFYRHHIEYDHAQANCAGLSVDTLAGLGWQVPKLGSTSRMKAILGYYYSSLTDWSFASGRRSYRYLVEERSRLYPRVAFETLSADLLALVTSPGRTLTPYEQLLRDEVEAIVFVRIPQIPSSRAFGTFPVASFDEYMARVPKNKADWKIIPVDARPFPDELRDREPAAPLLSDNVVGALAFGGLLVCLAAPFLWWRIRRRRR